MNWVSFAIFEKNLTFSVIILTLIKLFYNTLRNVIITFNFAIKIRKFRLAG